MSQSTIKILKTGLLAIACLGFVIPNPAALGSRTTLHKDRSHTVRHSTPSSPQVSTFGHRRITDLAGLNPGVKLQKKGGCPPADFDPNSPNLLRNPSFEEIGPRGRSADLLGGRVGVDDRSAATGWTMHTSNDRAPVNTEVVKSNRLKGGDSMLHIRAGSNEGGVYQLFERDDHGPERVVASVWVFVNRGRAVLATGNEGNTPNYALSTTTGKWERLQACSDGTTTNNWFVVYSTDVDGSDFFVDLASVSKVQTIANKCGGMMIQRIVPNVTFPGGTIALNGDGFGREQGTKLPSINRGHVNLLQVTRWTDTQVLARVPLDLVGGTYRVMIYCDDNYRTYSNTLEVTVRDDIHRPR